MKSYAAFALLFFVVPMHSFAAEKQTDKIDRTPAMGKSRLNSSSPTPAPTYPYAPGGICSQNCSNAAPSRNAITLLVYADAKGSCSITVKSSCYPYACGNAKTCNESCASDNDCANGATCDTTASSCVPTSNTCDGYYSVRNASGNIMNCAGGYRCFGGQCQSSCDQATDCSAANGFTCNLTTHFCVHN